MSSIFTKVHTIQQRGSSLRPYSVIGLAAWYSQGIPPSIRGPKFGLAGEAAPQLFLDGVSRGTQFE
eukprot:scaffold1320_cov253-Pinguiococcus_pyrenoidosus.AAC.10